MSRSLFGVNSSDPVLSAAAEDGRGASSSKAVPARQPAVSHRERPSPQPHGVMLVKIISNTYWRNRNCDMRFAIAQTVSARQNVLSPVSSEFDMRSRRA